MDKSEDNLIAWIAARYPKGDLPIGIGDDMAMLPNTGAGILVTTDMLMDGVDFDARLHTPEQIGRKALAVSLSDCAAMAVRPRWVLVSLALPNAWSMNMAQRLYQGMEPLAQKYDCHVVGGDTNSWDEPLVIDVITLAEPWPGIPPVLRTGLQAFDIICVTGELGGSLAGHHLDFEPRIQEAHWLAKYLGTALHAMMDISDGLSVDAGRLAKVSGVGIVVDGCLAEGVASRAAQLATKVDGRTCLDHVLNDGEDFELLFAVEPNAWSDFKESREGQRLLDDYVVPRFRAVGTTTEEPGLWLDHPDTGRIPLAARGWQHFTN